MLIEKTSISGVYLITPKKIVDERGFFVKTFHADIYCKHGLETDFKEEYYSSSKQYVLRGMHFQLPPHEHVKLVYCIAGEVLDVVLDLRVNSSTDSKILYIPKGLAHGFMSLSDNATLVYKTSTVYSPESDAGILWNSFGFEWPFISSVISERDKKFLSFVDFNSPFTL